MSALKTLQEHSQMVFCNVLWIATTFWCDNYSFDFGVLSCLLLVLCKSDANNNRRISRYIGNIWTIFSLKRYIAQDIAELLIVSAVAIFHLVLRDLSFAPSDVSSSPNEISLPLSNIQLYHFYPAKYRFRLAIYHLHSAKYRYSLAIHVYRFWSSKYCCCVAIYRFW